MLPIVLLLVNIFMQMSKSTDGVWTYEQYQCVKNLLRAGKMEEAFVRVNTLSTLNDTKYWANMPGVIFHAFSKDANKLFIYALTSFDYGYADKAFYYRIARRLLELGELFKAKRVIFITSDDLISRDPHIYHTLEHLDEGAYGKELFMLIQSTNPENAHDLYDICLVLFETHLNAHPEDLGIRRIFAKTLVALNIKTAAIDQYQIVTNHTNFINNDTIHWQACIEFGNLLMSHFGTIDPNRNPYLWAINRIRYNKPVINGKKYYEEAFEWIKNNVVDDAAYFMILANMAKQFPHDMDYPYN